MSNKRGYQFDSSPRVWSSFLFLCGSEYVLACLCCWIERIMSRSSGLQLFMEYPTLAHFPNKSTYKHLWIRHVRLSKISSSCFLFMNFVRTCVFGSLSAPFTVTAIWKQMQDLTGTLTKVPRSILTIFDGYQVVWSCVPFAAQRNASEMLHFCARTAISTTMLGCLSLKQHLGSGAMEFPTRLRGNFLRNLSMRTSVSYEQK